VDFMGIRKGKQWAAFVKEIELNFLHVEFCLLGFNIHHHHWELLVLCCFWIQSFQQCMWIVVWGFGKYFVLPK
jgi:hypothetical protein